MIEGENYSSSARELLPITTVGIMHSVCVLMVEADWL
jgi:hypothetical protein